MLIVFTIAPTISHTHVCSVWLYPYSQTHKTDAQLGCFCTAKRTRSRSQHPSSLSCLSSQLQGRDFKLKETTSFGLIRPQTRFTPLLHSSRVDNKLRISLALLLSSFTVENSGCFCSAFNCSNGSNSNLWHNLQC